MTQAYRIFISAPTNANLTPEQLKLKESIIGAIIKEGFEPQEFFRSGIPKGMAWSFEKAELVMSRCHGIAILAFVRWLAYEGKGHPSNEERNGIELLPPFRIQSLRGCIGLHTAYSAAGDYRRPCEDGRDYVVVGGASNLLAGRSVLQEPTSHGSGISSTHGPPTYGCVPTSFSGTAAVRDPQPPSSQYLWSMSLVSKSRTMRLTSRPGRRFTSRSRKQLASVRVGSSSSQKMTPWKGRKARLRGITSSSRQGSSCEPMEETGLRSFEKRAPKCPPTSAEMSTSLSKIVAILRPFIRSYDDFSMVH